jgi:hypothetical protein
VALLPIDDSWLSASNGIPEPLGSHAATPGIAHILYKHALRVKFPFAPNISDSKTAILQAEWLRICQIAEGELG